MMTPHPPYCRHDQSGDNTTIALETNPLTRLKPWQVNHFFKCPLVGMCLTQDEQRQLLKKTRVLDKGDSAYDMHEKMVASLESENRLSRRIDALLERKFGRSMQDFLSSGADAVMAHFKIALESGEIAGGLWNAATHPALSAQNHREVFGNVHMAMHWTAEERLQLTRRLGGQKRELVQLHEQRKRDAGVRRSLKKTIETLQQEKAALQGRLRTAETENENLRHQLAGSDHFSKIAALEQENQSKQAENEQFRQQLAEARETLGTLMARNRKLSDQMARQRELNRHFRQESRVVIGELAAMNRCDASCPAFDLCRKRVLIVGGITRMESAYRKLIEGYGGSFDYHDGYVKRGAKGLELCFKRADVVLCPVNCNSHAACKIVKNLGKKHNKPVHMLASSSLSAVSQVIQEDRCVGRPPN
ncbi:DUF2325 domain-containing protein [Desulfosarcina ovata]|uniref:DUF2325 domain-containing protein n=1 Tax=Desulfosarcina ovata subsp. ovata TaxID=2752305 RepID=A0A5K8AFX9_9BACT|nr:DUF2325 domain-containing protein [Desulfosarcina ovata]BBO90770.1 hypothetical protein DSCOOX_39500 [Desulfosarcina ovata subsp. ovata]